MAHVHERSEVGPLYRADLTRRLTTTHEEGRKARVPEVLRTNADDRLSVDALGRVEGGDAIVEGRDSADV